MLSEIAISQITLPIRSMTIHSEVPGSTRIDTLLAAPILRRTQCDRLTLWVATSMPVKWRLALFPTKHDSQVHEIRGHCRELKAAEQLYIQKAHQRTFSS